MSTYRELLLSTGGGVIGNKQLDKQEACATIAIGLGGTGVSCLRNLKRQVYARLEPDNPESDLPSYGHIKFLAVDTDKKSLNADGKINSLDEITEFFDISTPAIGALIAAIPDLSTKPEFFWLKKEDREKGEPGLKILAADAGAGGVRQVGRLLLIQKSAEFVERVANLINEAKTGLPGGCPVNIHIFTGMGGGTGSGTFLDVCYLVQEALRNVGEYGHALTCGYFFLPDVNLSVPEVSANPAVSSYIKVNGFAAMKELDYCMNFENNGGSWDQQYMGFHIGPVVETPVKVCHLVSAQTSGGMKLEHGYDYAMNVVGDFVMQFLVKNSITMESHIANYFTAMAHVRKEHGANYTHCLLGAANAVIPFREINTYLASRLFERMAETSGKIPTDGEILNFANANGISYQALAKSIQAGTSCQMPVIQLDYKLFTNMSEEDLGMQGEMRLPETIMIPFESLQEKMVNQLEKNMQSLIQPWAWDNLQMDGSSISVACKTYVALSALVTDPQCGPLYAATALNGSGRKNLVSILRGIRAQAQEERGNLQKNMGLRIEETKRARSAFLHPGLSKRAKLFDAFMARVQRYFSDDSRIRMLEKLDGMLPNLIQQLESLYEVCFEPYAKVNQNLIDTFRENLRTLTDKAVGKAVEDPFIIPLMKIGDMQESLDDAVKKMRLEDEMSEFQHMLFSNPRAWNNGDGRKISKCVSSYLVNKFSDYTNRTLTDYLEIRFNTEIPEQLIDKTYEEIMIPLSQKATPLFWKAGTYQIASASPLGYCSVPDASATVQAAADKLKLANPELRPVTSSLTDRIFLLRCTCGVPMFAYNGIEDYGRRYKADTIVGKHLYERTPLDGRDWTNLFDLVPWSCATNRTDEGKADSAVYDEAVGLGIVRQRPGVAREYQIVITPSADEMILEVKQACDSRDYGKIRDQKERFAEYMENLQPERLIAVPNDGMQGHEKTVRKDHIMASGELIGFLSDEIEKKKKLETAMAQLEEAEENLTAGAHTRQQFYDALYTGLITCKGRVKVLYIRDEGYGLTEEVPLSEPSRKPYGGVAPLYQAFYSFQELGEEDREAIVAQSEKRKDDVSGELAEACSQLQTIFDTAYVRSMQDNMRKQFPAEADAFKEFIRNFMEGLNNFRLMYGV